MIFLPNERLGRAAPGNGERWVPRVSEQGAHVAQLVERVLGKDEVISSILIMGSIN